jgi:hypothetical protein
MGRYVNIRINECIYPTEEDAIAISRAFSFPTETVRILSAEEEKEFKAEIVEECKNELLQHLAEVEYKQNGYPIRAVPQSTILSLPALMKIESDVNNWKREFAWKWFSKLLMPEYMVRNREIFEQLWKEQS